MTAPEFALKQNRKVYFLNQSDLFGRGTTNHIYRSNYLLTNHMDPIIILFEL